MASASAETADRANRRSGFFVRFLRREGLLVAIVGAYAAALSVRLPRRISQDTWLALLGGRDVLHRGLPGADTLTYWTTGREWIDQQWLAQVGAYGLYAARGLKAVALAHVGLVTLALALAVFGARIRGASVRATAWVTVATIYPLVLTSGYVRTQSVAYPLFVSMLLLVLADQRAPTARVFLALPLLALWANLHGSVVLGAMLVALRGLSAVASRQWLRGALLVVGSLLAVFATPWGLRIWDYYSATLFDPSFRNLVSEWRAPSLTLSNAPLFALAAFAIWVLGRCHGRFTTFERASVLLLVAFAFASSRNGVWLALGAVPLLAPALAGILPDRGGAAFAKGNLVVSLGGIAVTAVAIAYVVGRSPEAFSSPFPPRAAAVVSGAVKGDPSLLVYSDVRYADWLLFTVPELRGRVTYDARFELLTASQIESIVRWRTRAERWQAAARGARLLVLSTGADRRVLPELLTEPGLRTLYRDGRVSVLLRP